MRRIVHNEKLFRIALPTLVSVTLIYVLAMCIVLGLESLTRPYTLAAITSVLGSSSAYLEMLGSKKSSKSLRYIGRMLMIIGLATLILLITKLLRVL